MDHSFLTLGNLYNCTDSIEYLHDLTFVDITNFDILQYSLDEF